MGQITIPNAFSAGQIISAALVNADLDALAVAALDKSGDTMTGVLLVAAPGSVSAPAIGAAGDTHTGIYFPAADSLAITLGGTQRFLANSSGLTAFGVNFLNSSGKLPALSSTYLADLSGANLTNLAAANLSGTTLPGTIVTSELTAVGTITSGTWSGSFGAVSGANLTTLNASNLASGTVAVARLGSGTPSATTYLRGDGAWQDLPNTPTTWASLTGTVPNISIFTNNSGYQTAAGSVAYATSAGGVAWTNVSSHPTNLSEFTNGPGFIASTYLAALAVDLKPSADAGQSLGAASYRFQDAYVKHIYLSSADETTGVYYPLVLNSSTSQVSPKTNGLNGSYWLVDDAANPTNVTITFERGIVTATGLTPAT